MNIFQNISPSGYITVITLSAFAALFFITLSLMKILANRKFLKKLDRIIKDRDSFDQLIGSVYNADALYRKTDLIDYYASHKNREIISILGMDEIWISRLSGKYRRRDFGLVLKYAPEKGLFTCFLTCLKKKKFLPVLIRWLEKSGDMLYLRRIALSGKGEQFDGALAGRIFADRIQQVREMTGDPEWAPRYFAVKVLMHQEDPLAKRALLEMISDSHPLIRSTIAAEFLPEDRESFYRLVYDMMLHDSSEEVRKRAWQRITSDFSDMFNPEFSSFTESEKLHYIGFLRDGSESDINLAMTILEEPNLELRYPAALFLGRNRQLSGLLQNASFTDAKALDRTISLLKNSCEVNVTDFLGSCRGLSNPGAFHICSILLQQFGLREHINSLAEKVFSLYTGQAEYRSVYENTLKCISERGNEKGCLMMKSELMKRRNETDTFELILENIPVRSDYIFLDYLFDLFTGTESVNRNAVRKTLLSFGSDLVLSRVFDIVKSERSRYGYEVRREALRLLGELKLDYCLETVMESLPVFTPQEAREYFAILREYPKKLFIDKIHGMLETNDSKIRASLIAVLPVTGETSFIRQIDPMLKDADPDVRIACVWALSEFGDAAAFSHSVDLLRDPVERVRTSVAEAIGVTGNKKAVLELKKVLFDENEVDSVKSAVMKGLSASTLIESVEILVEFLETETELRESAINALSAKTDSKSLVRLIENFKDATPDLRKIISEVFIKMEKSSEKYLDDVVKEEIGSLKPYLAEILHETGYIESKIRKLAHRSPQIRRSAADFLSLIGSTAAFRGIVLASRDPDEEVRIKVIKALEKLETKDGREILNSLLEDPDRRIRKYTKWALERLKAKSL